MSNNEAQTVVTSHGFGAEDVSADWTAITEADIHQLLQHYPGLGRLQERLWRSPRPFSAAELVTTSYGRLFIKRYHQSIRTAAALMEEHRFMRHLAQQGIPVAFVFSNEHGESAMTLGEWTYEAQAVSMAEDRYRDVRSWEPFLTGQDAYAAGEMLARLHRASASFHADARVEQPLIANFQLLGQADPLAALQVWLTHHPRVAGYLAGRDWQREFVEAIGDWHRAIQPFVADLPALWTHNDWHASNLLWQCREHGHQVATVIDFGLSDRTFALFDLATAIERNCVPWLALWEGETIEADYLALEQLLNGYQQVLPLSAQTLGWLADLLPIVHVDFALSELAYFLEVLDQPAQADLCWEGYLLQHAHWFNTPAGVVLRNAVRRHEQAGLRGQHAA